MPGLSSEKFMQSVLYRGIFRFFFRPGLKSQLVMVGNWTNI